MEELLLADLENIEITRINNISDGGGRKMTKINLIRTLEFNDNSENIRILDGDTIFVGKNDFPAINQISSAIKSNINPKYISVGIFGRVENPGSVKVSKSATLNEAIVLNGGTKFLKGKVRFLRYNNDGSVDNRIFNFRGRAKRGSLNNPYLRNGDLIFVGKSNLNLANEVITEITSPFQGIVSAYGFYKILAE